MKYLIALLLACSLFADEEYPRTYAGNVVTITKYTTVRNYAYHFPSVTYGFWANRTDAEAFAVQAAASIMLTNDLQGQLNYNQAGNYKIYQTNGTSYTLKWFVETISVTNAPYVEVYTNAP